MSNLLNHAKRELELAGAGDTLYGEMLPEAVLELLKVFADQGHSGMSASVVRQLFNKLSDFEPLTPLTGEDDEWNEIGENYFQNNRCSHVFKENGRAYDSRGKIFRDPTGATYTSINSRVNIEFPYIPTTEYVDVQE